MPLALSRTARALNSWAPNGQISIVGLNGTFKKDLDPNAGVDLLPDPVYLPQKPSTKSITPLLNGSTRRQQRRKFKSAALQAIELNLKPFRNGGSNNGFAQEPKPKNQDSPVVNLRKLEQEVPCLPQSNGTPAPPPVTAVQSRNNQDVHFGAPGSGKRRRFSFSGGATVPEQTVCPDASVHCASALSLTTGSPQSIGHLRKWNSQSYLGAASRDLPKDPDLRLLERPALRRNASLPDLRLAEQLDATGLHRARPRVQSTDLTQMSPLMRSPSDTGRALCFWVEDEDGVKAFHEMPAARRAKYEQKIALYRRQREASNTSSSKLTTSKGVTSMGDAAAILVALKAAGRPASGLRPGSPHVVVTGDSELLTLSPQLLAQELTQLGRELLLAVEPAELLTYVMKPRMAEMETCPNLHRLLHFYDRLSALVTSEILRNQIATSRAQTLAMFVETADHCHSLQNWQSCRALLSAIRSPPIVRLRDTWYHLRKDFPEHFSMFERLVMDGVGEDDSASESVEAGGRPRPLAAVPYFGEIVARVRARPTVQRLRPARALWKEPPSLAKWVDEQTSGATECDQCLSRSHRNRACCYLMVFVLGKNLFCPIRRMPLDSEMVNLNQPVHDASPDNPGDSNVLQRMHLAQIFDDPDTLPFTSNLVQCCALQPGNIVHIRQRVEIFLRSAQAAARAYDLESNPRARHYWLQQPYSSMIACMKRSVALEPLGNTKTQQRQL